MGTNAELSEIFGAIADLLDLAGERFKPEAYRRAARSIDSLTEDVRKVADRGGLREIPGVGEAIEEKIREYLRDGRIPYFEKIRGQFPPGIIEIMKLPGIGPKTARRFLLELKVEGPKELLEAVDSGRLQGVKGFGPRKVELIRKALAATEPPKGRTPLLEAWEIARQLVEALRSGAPVDQVEIAGSLRRRRESVGDLDLLATSREPEKVFDRLSSDPHVASIVLRGPTKETVLLKDGLQIDLRVVEPAAFGATWQYFTGSKDHNVRLRTLARDLGLKVNEYGVFRGEERIAGATEEEVYRSLGLPWIPSEIRENSGEFEAAQAGKLPKLVAASDLHGDLHIHLAGETGPKDVEALLEAAHRRSWRYLGVIVPVAESCDGVLAAATVRFLEERRRATGEAIRLLLGEEFDGTNAPHTAIERDYWVLRGSAGTSPPAHRDSPGAGSPPLLAAHLTPSEGSTGSPSGSLAEWVDWAQEIGTALEVAPTAPAGALDSAAARRASEHGVLLHASSSAATGAELDRIELSVGLLRRAWVAPEGVLNAAPWAPPRPARPKP
ncbi:MAG: helix-hairpin-helix domain-containing protein [Thermoplasmata archaeon]|nr:helix-hairpin-helix domain-containing protein [Thermoplasmata archaeon]